MIKCKALLTAITLVALSALDLHAKVILPSIFADHMVLQQNTRIKIWGWADPWEQAKISLSWSDQVYQIKGDANAAWFIHTDTPAAGGPHSITITTADETIEIKDILFGEVWICAGQSNMEWSAKHGVKDALQELPQAYNANIRLFKMQKRGHNERRVDVHGQWSLCDSSTLYNFSAVGYFFGKHLWQTLNAPIGLIDMAWGGSFIESWIPSELIELYPLTRESARLIPPSNHWPQKAGYIFNGMVNPIIDYPFAGIIWYQGESNTHFPSAYLQLQQMLVENWRRAAQNDFPFYYVQIAPFVYRQDTTQIQAAFVREMQSLAQTMHKTGMVVTTDLVDNLKDVHPAYKSQVGKRLANYALAEHYQKPIENYKSPSFAQYQVKGNRVIVTLNDVSKAGLEIRGAGKNEFYIAGKDKQFVAAQVRILDTNKIEVWSNEIAQPVTVRFAFSNAPEPNLYDKAGLPVAPFRTDDW